MIGFGGSMRFGGAGFDFLKSKEKTEKTQIKLRQLYQKPVSTRPECPSLLCFLNTITGILW